MDEKTKAEVLAMIERQDEAIEKSRIEADKLSLMRLKQPNDALELALAEQLEALDKAMATKAALQAALT